MLNKITFIGAGSMSEAIIAGIVKSGFLQSEQIFVTNKKNQERLDHLQDRYQVQCMRDNKGAIENADIIILSMKPADIKSAGDSIKEYIKPNQLIVSVAAGISTDYISKHIEKANPVIRAMPNTSASIGYSATTITAGENATEEHIQMSESLFKTIGITEVIDEEHMHTVTGVSGSGPAYIYYLVETMEKAAVEAGLDKDIAMALITQTIIGAGKMLEQTGETASDLRKKVTSPSGTTEAGIKKLMELDFEKTIIECINSARDRSIELGKEFQ